ncbi:MAG: hypothetical protein FWE44_02735 [Defluviitaleaceae bacterium]|nr:hypothetical protein [Defluviitaleaceae bacterium]
MGARMEDNLLLKSGIGRKNSQNCCKDFDNSQFPFGAFNPPQKDEFLKRICDKKCRKCPFFGWPMPGPQGPQGIQGPQGPQGDLGIDLKLLEEASYTALSEDEKHKPNVLWVVYPDNFFAQAANN